ncbi:alpha/beta hydrolase [Nannocystis sp.]|uniref:alpha/beta fold hydrolase n=1 Tax=Nannocystis sp. TaxID=1962667 RepID=UPI0025EFEFF3|nr:alpha/beta hydrolase [Nannocystis sp.]MBK7825815.1 alpha/beta hydrolase [Nannocystis sp.]
MRALLANDRSLVGPDGGLLAYRVEGRGPALLLTNGITTSNFFWSYLHRRWAPRHTVINWDLKGHGRSAPARSPEAASIDALADDLLRVLDAAGQRRATLVGFSMGCQVSLEAYRRAPERVAALVLLLGPAGRVFDNALGPLGKLLHLGIEHMSPRVFNLGLRGVQRVVGSPIAYRLGRSLRLVGPAATRADVQRFVDHFVRDIDPATLGAMALAAQAHSAHDLLPQIRVPTLIVAGDSDVFAPGARVGALMQRQIPGAELLRLPYGTHTSLFEHHAEIGAAIDDFLARRVPEDPQRRKP